MLPSPIPSDESERLQALFDLHMLDTPPEERFDIITEIATKLFNVSISTITLIDANREWFKSVCGLDQKEGDRAVSFCGHALLSDELLIIPDALQDERFADNPMVVGPPHIRFYAGVPLFSASGKRIGVLCIKDQKPKTLSDSENHLLRGLSKWAELEINTHNLSLALQKIEESVVELDTFFSISQDLMCVAGIQGNFKKINPSFTRIFGYSMEELLNKPFVEFIHPDDREFVGREIGKLSAGTQVDNIRVRFQSKDGNYLWTQWNASPHGQDIYATGREITQAKEREEELQQFNRLMVGRELKMVELKEEIEKLKKQISAST